MKKEVIWCEGAAVFDQSIKTYYCEPDIRAGLIIVLWFDGGWHYRVFLNADLVFTSNETWTPDLPKRKSSIEAAKKAALKSVKQYYR
ncbi:MAG: hypothetical protein JXK16_04500 [Thiotrichales bacterium]|nr:hypothetical protein [Thiotrichales bacterium]